MRILTTVPGLKIIKPIWAEKTETANRVRDRIKLEIGQGDQPGHPGAPESHGLSGVEARHYDGHDYLPQIREALELLIGELERTKVKGRKAASKPGTGIPATR